MKLEEGMDAPEIDLPDAAGRVWRLRDLAGKPAVLYFYPVDDTPGCTTQACDFRDSLSNFQSADYTVLGISPQDADSHDAFASKYGLTFPLLVDSELRVAKAYGAVAERRKLFEGIPLLVKRSTFVIDANGKIAHALYGVKAKGHVARLRELLEVS
jgi:thioredoxin-dependent peroxiredoxin